MQGSCSLSLCLYNDLYASLTINILLPNVCFDLLSNHVVLFPGLCSLCSWVSLLALTCYFSVKSTFLFIYHSPSCLFLNLYFPCWWKAMKVCNRSVVAKVKYDKLQPWILQQTQNSTCECKCWNKKAFFGLGKNLATDNKKVVIESFSSGSSSFPLASQNKLPT